MVKPKVSRLSAEPSPARILWMSSHLPRSRRSGVDARHLDMMQILASRRERDRGVRRTRHRYRGREDPT